MLIFGPRNLGSRGGLGPQGPPLDPHLNGFLYIQLQENILFISFYICISFFNLLETFWINHKFGASMSA